MNNISRQKIEKSICAICWVLMPIYLFYVISLTLRGRGDAASSINLTPLYELRRAIRSRHHFYWIKQIMGNIALLMPLGIMVPFMLKIMRGPVRIAALAFCASLGIESLQLISGRGIFELDDLMHNTLGAVIGYFVYLSVTEKVLKEESTANEE